MSGFRNPVIPGFFPDPSVCRAGGEYFLVTSSFTYFPGVPVFRSADLADWEQVGNVLDRPSQLDLSKTSGNSSAGVYAPTIRYHAGRFWAVTTCFNDGIGRTFLVTAEDPAGAWSDPVYLDIEGIDPDIAWDDDGNCLVHFTRGTGIMRCRIDDSTGAVLQPPTLAWPGTGLQWPEAPHLLRRGETWYLLIAEGGTASGHTVAIARGPSPEGPWEGCPSNPILTHRSTGSPIQNTGHADLVEAADGSWWMVLLGVRPRGATPAFHVLGRETFLTPVEWAGGWPVPGDLALEMPTAPPGFRGSQHAVPGRDDFDATALGPEWVSVRFPLGESASLAERPGWLTLHGNGQDLDADAPVFAARRQQHHWCRARALVDPGDSAEAGLAVRMDEGSHYEVFVRGGEIAVRARIGPLAHVFPAAPLPSGDVILRVETREGGRGPDRILLGYEADGSFRVLADLDGRYLSTEASTGFIGRVIGLYSVAGTASFDWFDYAPTDTA